MPQAKTNFMPQVIYFRLRFGIRVACGLLAQVLLVGLQVVLVLIVPIKLN